MSQRGIHCQVYPHGSLYGGASQEHLSRKCADLFSEPQLERKCGRNASSLNLARLTCRSSRTAATLPTGGGKKRSRDCDVDGGRERRKPILERSSDCTVHLSLATDLFLLHLGLHATRYLPAPPGV
jgi:hypothetical protein